VRRAATARGLLAVVLLGVLLTPALSKGRERAFEEFHET
jgi:hypothetical protein